MPPAPEGKQDTAELSGTRRRIWSIIIRHLEDQAHIIIRHLEEERSRIIIRHLSED